MEKKKLAILLALIMTLTMCVFGFSACGSQVPEEEDEEYEMEDIEEVDEEDAEPGAANDDLDIGGIWADEISQRASIEIEQNDDGSYTCLVSWSESYEVMDEWEFTGKFDGDTMTYADGIRTVLKANDDEEMVEESSEETSGSLTLKDGKLEWSDSAVEEPVVFIRADE